MSEQNLTQNPDPNTPLSNQPRGKLPETPFECIALGLSGGGYRAATFSLGTLSYLNRIRWGAESLLRKVRVLSTVSGGTFAGVMYSSFLYSGRTFEDAYKQLYSLLDTVDLPKLALEKMTREPDRYHSLIVAFAQVYHELFFNEQTFEIYYKPRPDLHLQEVIFNSTEFKRGLPFRFLKGINDGIFGNYYLRVPKDVAMEIRLAHVVAATSCFPAGFEPLCFPGDFVYDGAENIKVYKAREEEYIRSNKLAGTPEIGLMDGGIVDNQGIGSILQSQRRRKFAHDKLEEAKRLGKSSDISESDTKGIDLIIISDVASPFMDKYEPVQRKEANTRTLVSIWQGISSSARTIIVTAMLFAIIGLVSTSYIISQLLNPDHWGFGGWVVLILHFAIILLVLVGLAGLGFLLRLVTRNVPGLVKRYIPGFAHPLIPIASKLRTGQLKNMLANRVASVMTLNLNVFLKQVRRLVYSTVYEDPDWEYARISNLIYDLAPDRVKERKKKKNGKDSGSTTMGETLSDKIIERPGLQLPKELLEPGEKIMTAAGRARRFGTTLWFTEEEKKENLLRTLVATGQFSICFNLLEYIYLLESHPGYNTFYTGEVRNQIRSMKESLDKDWSRFKGDPYWMVDQMNKELGL